MTLLDAKQFDAEKESRKRKRLVLIITVLVIILCLGWWFRYWREEHIVGNFFAALQKQDFKTAYGIWMHDPNWAAHPGDHGRNLPGNRAGTGPRKHAKRRKYRKEQDLG